MSFCEQEGDSSLNNMDRFDFQSSMSFWAPSRTDLEPKATRESEILAKCTVAQPQNERSVINRASKCYQSSVCT